jgi:hypothetical protein
MQNPGFFFFFISKIPVSTPNEGVWDWVVVGKLGLQLLQVHCQSKTGGPPEVGAVQRAVQPLLWLLAKNTPAWKAAGQGGHWREVQSSGRCSPVAGPPVLGGLLVVLLC